MTENEKIAVAKALFYLKDAHFLYEVLNAEQRKATKERLRRDLEGADYILNPIMAMLEAIDKSTP